MKTLSNHSIATILAVALSYSVTAKAATSGSHYNIGTEGVEAGSPPPAGFHYRQYDSWYNSEMLTDNRGNDSDAALDVHVFAQAHRLVFVTDKKLLGANWAVSAIIPLVSKDISIGAIDYSSKSHWELGDTVLEPLALFWYGKHYNAIFAVAAIAPTGGFSADRPETVGLGYWSSLVTAGGTLYLDDENSWSISLLSRTMHHTKQQKTDVRPGAEFAVEGGLGKQINVDDQWLIRPGINYAASYQFSDDSIDTPSSIATQHKRVLGLGAEINLMYLPWLLQTNVRYLNEFSARNTTDGQSIVVTITKSF